MLPGTKEKRPGRVLLCCNISGATHPSYIGKYCHNFKTTNTKLRRPSSKQMQGVLLDTEETDTIAGEDITTYHYIRSRKWSKARVISQIPDDHGDLQNEKEAIIDIFTSFLLSKYKAIPCNINSVLYLTSGDMPNIPKRQIFYSRIRLLIAHGCKERKMT